MPTGSGISMNPVPVEAAGGSVGAKEAPAAPKAKRVVGVVHRTLRAATRDDHASIDRMLLPFNLNKVEDYRVFLNIHFGALAALQADWRLEDSEDFDRLLRCARVDLEILGCTTTKALSTLSRTPLSTAKGLGIAYVVRGSRLGAAVLRRGVGGKLPTSYLDFVPALSWTEFLVQLESIADDPAGRDDAVRAARGAFEIYSTEFTRLQGGIHAVPNENPL
jgi:heme oxygenase